MKRFFIPLLLLSLAGFRQHVPVDEDYHLAAEWEPQEAVWVGVFYGQERNLVTAAMIKAIYKEVPVRLNYAVDSLKFKYNRFLNQQHIDTSKLQWIKDSLSFNWVRDTGPLFLVNSNGDQKIICFGWNDYGRCYTDNRPLGKTDSIIGRTAIRMGVRLGIPVWRSPMVAEGGALETNGAGILMSIEETALQRNPGHSLPDIEKEYLRATGCKKMIWLKRMTLQEKISNRLLAGKRFTAGANGHIDQSVRFLNPSTIAIAYISDAERKRNSFLKQEAAILDEYYQVLKTATDIEGKPFQLVRVPVPDLDIYAVPMITDKEIKKDFPDEGNNLKTGDTIRFIPAVSYLNFMITNKVVLIPSYWQNGLPVKEKQKDEQVRILFEQFYPGRKIIQINPYAINGGGGGIHCATLEQPRRKRYAV